MKELINTSKILISDFYFFLFSFFPLPLNCEYFFKLSFKGGGEITVKIILLSLALGSVNCNWFNRSQNPNHCYITYDMDFQYVPSDSVCFDKLSRCDLWTGGWQCVGAVRSNRCVTGRRPHDNYAVRFRQRQRIRSRARGTQLIRGVRSSLMTWLARGCKRWHPLAPRRRYGTRRSPLSEYISLHLSLKLRTNCGPLSRIKWEIYWNSSLLFISPNYITPSQEMKSNWFAWYLKTNSLKVQYQYFQFFLSEHIYQPTSTHKIGLVSYLIV